MRYITPEIIIKGRFAEHPKPNWDIAVLCFGGPTFSGAILQGLNATPVRYKTLWGHSESTDLPHVHETAVGGTKYNHTSSAGWLLARHCELWIR